MTAGPLSASEVARLRAVAATLLPGDGEAPPAVALDDLDDLLQRAAAAIGHELDALRAAIASLPDACDLASLERLSATEPDLFELVATVTTGAYFMSPVALAAIGYPTGPRVAAPFDLAADELSTGILEPVIERGAPSRSTKKWEPPNTEGDANDQA